VTPHRPAAPVPGRLSSRDILRQGGWMFAAYFLSFFANAVFNMVMSRHLGVEDYGVLISLLSIFMVASVPLQAVQTVLMHTVARLVAAKDTSRLSALHGRTWVTFGLFALAVTALGLAARQPLASFLHLRAPNWVFHVVFMILGATAGTLTKAFLQGSQRYTEMGLQVSLDTMIRLCVAVGLVMAGVGVGGALFAQTLSSWLGAGLGLVFLSFYLRPLATLRKAETRFWEPRFAGPAALSMFLFSGLTLTDVAFARHWFAADVAGQYSAAATVGRVFQHGPFMLTAYMFPKAAYMHTRREDVRQLLKKTLNLTHWIVGASVLGCLFFSRPVVLLLFGGAYGRAAELLPWYALAMAPMAYNWVLSNYHLAVGDFRFLGGMGVAAVIFGVGLALFHGEPTQLMAVIAVSGVTLLSWNTLMLRRPPAA